MEVEKLVMGWVTDLCLTAPDSIHVNFIRLHRVKILCSSLQSVYKQSHQSVPHLSLSVTALLKQESGGPQENSRIVNLWGHRVLVTM